MQTTLRARIRRHPALSYFALTFAISIGGVLLVTRPSGIFGTREEFDRLMLLWSLALVAGPSMSGLLMTWLVGGAQGLREYRARLLRWRVAGRWYAIALLTAPVCFLADARVILGTRSYLGFEAGYLGTATGVYAPLGGEDAVLVSSTVEALARANFIARGAFQPYAVIGAGWRRFDVAQEDFSTASAGMNDTDDELVIPMGAGLAYRYGSLLADARFTFRVATEESLVLEDGAAATSDDYAPMHTWGVTTRIGYEF